MREQNENKKSKLLVTYFVWTKYQAVCIKDCVHVGMPSKEDRRNDENRKARERNETKPETSTVLKARTEADFKHNNKQQRAQMVVLGDLLKEIIPNSDSAKLKDECEECRKMIRAFAKQLKDMTSEPSAQEMSRLLRQLYKDVQDYVARNMTTKDDADEHEIKDAVSYWGTLAATAQNISTSRHGANALEERRKEREDDEHDAGNWEPGNVHSQYTSEVALPVLLQRLNAALESGY